MTIFWGLAGVCQPPSSFWSVTLQPVDAYQATIWQMKGDILSFYMRYRRLISIHRLQRKINFCPLSLFSLVLFFMELNVTFVPFPCHCIQTRMVTNMEYPKIIILTTWPYWNGCRRKRRYLNFFVNLGILDCQIEGKVDHLFCRSRVIR